MAANVDYDVIAEMKEEELFEILVALIMFASRDNSQSALTSGPINGSPSKLSTSLWNVLRFVRPVSQIAWIETSSTKNLPSSSSPYDSRECSPPCRTPSHGRRQIQHTHVPRYPPRTSRGSRPIARNGLATPFFICTAVRAGFSFHASSEPTHEGSGLQAGCLIRRWGSLISLTICPMRREVAK